jgi:hypothetical protein
MTPVPASVRGLIEAVQRRLRRDVTLTIVLSGLCAIPLLLVVAWLVGLMEPWSRPGAAPLLLELVFAAGVAAMIVYGVRRWLRSLDESSVAAGAERQAGMPEGTVRGLLELSREVPVGTSEALARRAQADIGLRLGGVPEAQLAGDVGRRVHRRRRIAAASLAVLTTTVLLLGVASPEHSRAAWAPLASPVRNLAHPPLPPLAVLTGDATIDRGTDLRVRVLAPGRTVVTVNWKSAGDVLRSELAAVSRDSAAALIPRVAAATDYWVEAPDGATSRRYRITPVDPLLVSTLEVEVHYPPYTNRPADRHEGEVPPLDVPEGTRLLVSGRATRPLGIAELGRPAAADVIQLDVEGAGFSGSFTPASSGLYAWRLVDAAGAPLSVAPAPLQVRVQRDAPPTVEIRFPADDTLLDASFRTRIVADARDDHGLTAAKVTSWRVDRQGRRGPDADAVISLDGGDAVLIQTLLDASGHGLLPGDTLKLQVRVTDNSPRRQIGVSRVVALRVPGRDELRERSVQRADDLLREAESVARAAGSLREATTSLERRTAAANARRAASSRQARTDAARPPGAARQAESRNGMTHREAEPARQLLEQHQELVERLEAMQRRLDGLERAMEQAGLHDAELQERIAELRRLQEELLTPEARQQLEQLRRALEELDADALQAALENMSRQQEQTREQLERSIEAMRQAAQEQRINNLAQEARELATQQQALAQEMARSEPSPEQARTQQELADRAKELARELAAMKERLESHGDGSAAERMGQARKDAEEAGERMEQAARDAAGQDGSSAAEQGEQAAAGLERTAEALEQTRRALSEARRQQSQDSVQQAASDALALAERQQELLDRMRQAEGRDSAGGEPAPDYDVVQPRLPRLPQPPRPQVSAGSERDRDRAPGDQGTTPQPGQQQGGQQQGGQQQGGQQQGGQQQGGQQQGGQQQGGQQQGGQQQGGQQQGGQQQGGQQQGADGQRPGGGRAGSGRGPTDMQTMRSDQAALQQGLQQLNRNLQEAAERNGALSREVGAAMARANRDMQQTLEAMQRGEAATSQAQQTVESLNRLALSLLHSASQMGQAEGGAGSQQVLPQLADLARQQGSLAGQSSSLAPMNLSGGAMSQQLERMAAEQLEIARRLGSLTSREGQDSPAEVQALAGEAESIARLLGTGNLPPEAVARQERLFHRLLDAGRTLEKDELDEQRTGERPGPFDPRRPAALDAMLFRDSARFQVPTSEELRSLPPGYRALILDYFERLNRPAPPRSDGTGDAGVRGQR